MTVEKKLIDRINELAKKAKEGSLTQEEIEERDRLRQEYLKQFRAQFRKQLENIEIEYID